MRLILRPWPTGCSGSGVGSAREALRGRARCRNTENSPQLAPTPDNLPQRDGHFAVLLACGTYCDFYVLAERGQEFHETPHRKTPSPVAHRSEERRVGKECRSRWSPY